MVNLACGAKQRNASALGGKSGSLPPEQCQVGSGERVSDSPQESRVFKLMTHCVVLSWAAWKGQR